MINQRGKGEKNQNHFSSFFSLNTEKLCLFEFFFYICHTQIIDRVVFNLSEVSLLVDIEWLLTELLFLLFTSCS